MTPPSLLRALAHRNFRLFFAGQLVSLIGTWMQQLALAWLVFQLTRSPGWLGLVGFAGQVPSFFLAPLAGVVADRVNRHRLIVATQTLMMLQAFAVAALDLTGAITVWHILFLSLFLGLVTVFDMTGRQAFLTEMVERREDLANAIALNSSMFNGARLVGPALAGLVLAQTSAGVCFLLNGVSYLAVLAALLAMRVTPRRREKPRTGLVQGVREGFGYAFGFPPIRALLLLLALVSLLGISYTVLLPVFATDVLQGGPETLGFLSTAAGLGALAGALLLASRKTVLGLGRWIATMPAVFGLALMAFAFCERLLPALACLLVAGFALMVQMAASNTVLQTIVDEDKRGRVMSLYTMAFMGTAPLGSLLAGFLGDALGVSVAVLLAGAGCVLGSVLFLVHYPALRRLIRPIYRQMGILPELATGVQSASELLAPPEERG